MDEHSLEILKFYLEDEQQRAAKCEDEYTKQLLLNRCQMWERLIKEKEDGVSNSQTATNASAN